jgi:UDP-N-acetyl-D-mannosaminuronate dehydrogenase
MSACRWSGGLPGQPPSQRSPHIPTWTIDNTPIPHTPNLTTALQHADLTILLAGHSAYDAETLKKHGRLILDTRGFTRDLPDTGDSIELL